MRNKKALYVLLPVVILIWGIIIYKFYKAFNSDEEIQQNNFSFSSLSPVKTTVDTFSILADYRDPFLGKIAATPSSSDKPKNQTKVEKSKPEPIVWPAIIYKGMIKNQKTGKQLYLVTINNQDNMMKPGDVFAEVELKKTFKDSIIVLYRKETKTIKK